MTEQPWWHAQDQPPPSHPSAAEEASRLFMAVRDRIMTDPTALRAGARLLETFSNVTGSANPVEPGQAEECAYCPFCQAMARAKAMSPETVERLTGATLEFAEAVRQIVLHPEDQHHADHVRHVPLDDDLEEDPADLEDGLEGDDPQGDPAV